MLIRIGTPIDLAGYLGHIDLKSAKSGGKKCSKGKVCGRTCIAQSRVCRIELKGANKAASKWLTSQDTGNDQPKKARTKKAEKEQERTVDAKPTLKAVDWNPDAIPDLKPKDFQEYLRRKQIMDGSIATFSEMQQLHSSRPWLGELTREKYKSIVLDGIRDGYVPSRSAIDDAGLSRAELGQVESNRKQQERWRQESEPIERALSHSIADEKANKEWKPQMSEQDADSFAGDGFFGQMAWYHGNRQEVTDSIATEGAIPERNNRGIYGQGVYFGIDRSIGEQYAGAASGLYDNVEVITTRIRSKKPYITTADDLLEIAKNFPDDPEEGVNSSASLSQYLRARGYDSIYLKDHGYGVAFDTKQVVTVKKEDVTSQGERLRKESKTSANKWKNNPNAQMLDSLSHSEKG